jgi:hypothetical protein
MMFKKLLLAVLVIGCLGVSCNTDCPPPKECPEPIACDSCCEPCPECPECPEIPPCESLECPEDYTLEKSELIWECKAPPAGPDVSLYVKTKDVQDILKKIRDSRPHLGYFADAYANWRDPKYVATHCTWALDGEVFDISREEMLAFSEEGQTLVHEMEDIIEHLPIVNRRCDFSHPQHHIDFCQVSNVRISRLEAYKSAVRPHNIKAYEWRGIAQRDPIREVCAYDGIRGWCQCVNGTVP